MEDTEKDCEGYGNHRLNHREPISPDPRNSSKFSSLEERNDSGLGSLGYFSQEFNSGSLSLLEEEEKVQKAEPRDRPREISLHPETDSGTTPTFSTDLENSLSRLNIGSIKNKAFEQCDSGLDEHERDSVLAARSYLTQCANLHWVSPHFTPDQILEIFRGDEDGDK
ncbi:hypothetical protein EGW08_015312 [Elysia chlorotica]|uniref:Uncharacterized protein n=1 Tax=Elysia chlorotica TaxID=188477 RepID=A0A433T5P1_ELYCH|nr:hypothetical protein EGW08_015312 [Elysia chlorotica]